MRLRQGAGGSVGRAECVKLVPRVRCPAMEATRLRRPGCSSARMIQTWMVPRDSLRDNSAASVRDAGSVQQHLDPLTAAAVPVRARPPFGDIPRTERAQPFRTQLRRRPGWLGAEIADIAEVPEARAQASPMCPAARNDHQGISSAGELTCAAISFITTNSGWCRLQESGRVGSQPPSHLPAASVHKALEVAVLSNHSSVMTSKSGQLWRRRPMESGSCDGIRESSA